MIKEKEEWSVIREHIYKAGEKLGWMGAIDAAYLHGLDMWKNIGVRQPSEKEFTKEDLKDFLVFSMLKIKANQIKVVDTNKIVKEYMDEIINRIKAVKDIVS